MAVNLNMPKLKQNCVQFLTIKGFKNVNESSFDILTEIPFIQLFKQVLSKDSNYLHNLKEYEDVLFGFFQRKANGYSQQLFKTIMHRPISAVTGQTDILDPDNIASRNPIIYHELNIIEPSQMMQQSNAAWLEKLTLNTKTIERQLKQECKKLRKECEDLLDHNQILQSKARAKDDEIVDLQKKYSDSNLKPKLPVVLHEVDSNHNLENHENSNNKKNFSTLPSETNMSKLTSPYRTEPTPDLLSRSIKLVGLPNGYDEKNVLCNLEKVGKIVDLIRKKDEMIITYSTALEKELSTMYDDCPVHGNYRIIMQEATESDF